MIYLGFISAEDNRPEHHRRGVSLVLQMLEAYAGVSVFERDILHTADGRPYIDSEDVDFSLSHSGELAVCLLWVRGGVLPDCRGISALGEGCEINAGGTYFIDTSEKESLPDFKGVRVGVDIELVDREKREERLEAIAGRCFSSREYEYITDGGTDPVRFYEIWTKKESRGKMLGCGLRGILSGEAPTDNAAYLESFSLKYQGGDYVLSLCYM